MASLSGQTIVLMLMLLFAMAIAGEVDLDGLRRKRRFIKITNDLWSGSDMTVHCKSQDDDLGEKTLPRGGKYEFNFRPNIYFFSPTRFFCSFRFENQVHYYEVYTGWIECSQCWYSVRNSGEICRYDWDTRQYDKCSPDLKSSEIDPDH